MYFSKIMSLLGNRCPVSVPSTRYTLGIANRCEGGPDTFRYYGLEKNGLYIWLHMFNFFLKKKLHDWKKYVYSICKTVLSVFVSSHVNWKNIKSTALLRMAVFTYRRAEQFILFIWAISYFHLKADTLMLQSYWGFYIKKKRKKMLPWRNILPYYTEVGRKFVLEQNLPLSKRSRDAVLTPLGV